MKIKLFDNSNLLVLHHWDCDGICSSVLLEKYLKNINPGINIEFFIPKIGNYFLDERDHKTVINKNPDILFIGIEIHRPSIEQVLKQVSIQGLDNLLVLDYDARLFM